MIKANELRTGNYLYSDPLIIPRLGITSESYSQINAYGIHMVEEGILNPKPLPLTEDWLIKFGFRKMQTDITEYGIFIGAAVLVVSLDIDGKWYVCAAHKVFAPSVHTLQNLYFAMTGEELTLNETK